jgi:hypothetical protein
VETGHGVVIGLLPNVFNLLRDVGRILRDLAGFLPDVGNLPSNVGRLLRDSGAQEQCLLAKVVNLVNEELVHHLGRLYGGCGWAVCTGDGSGQGRAVFPKCLVRKVPQNLGIVAGFLEGLEVVILLVPPDDS